MIFWDVHESGRPDAPTVLLSSGLGGTASYWAPQLAALQARYRVIAYDQAGTGRNKRDLPDDHSIAAMADEALAVLDATRTDQAHFVGHALGGLVGLDLATRHPQRLRSLTVVNGWAAAHAHTRRCFDVRLTLLRDSGPRAYVHAQPLFLFPPEWNSARTEELLAEEEVHLAHFPGVEMMQRRIAAARLFNAADRLSEVTVPTLCIASEDDMLVPPHCSIELAKAVSGAQCITMRGGHACNVTQPKEFNDLVQQWVYGEN